MPFPDQFKLDGKVALITGGVRGLGRTMATALAEAGADVAITARTRDACTVPRQASSIELIGPPEMSVPSPTCNPRCSA